MLHDTRIPYNYPMIRIRPLNISIFRNPVITYLMRKMVACIGTGKRASNNAKFYRTTIALNAAYLVSALSDRMWAFSIGLFLSGLGGMIWVAIQQLVDSLCKLVLIPILGPYLDKMNRLRAMQIILLINNVCISLSAATFWISLSSWKDGSGVPWLYLFFAIFFGSISRVASEAQKTAFTKDWIVVIASTTEDTRLSTMNMTLTVIDQAASLLTPLFAGMLLDFLPRSICCLIIIAWNIISWALEAAVLLYVYNNTEELSTKSHETVQVSDSLCCSCGAYAVYGRQKSFLPAFALALLYMTVLGFDNLAISYGDSHGMSATTLGIFRAMGSALGLFGAIAYSFLERRIGLLWAAFIGLTIQNIFINFCSTSVFLPGNTFNATGYFDTVTKEAWLSEIYSRIAGTPLLVDNSTLVESLAVVSTVSTELSGPFGFLFVGLSPSILLFFLGITLARFGLWIADPSITQIMQETVPEAERYTVFGVQTSICEFFSVVKDVLVILFNSPSCFGMLILISCGFVFIGYVLFSAYFVRQTCFCNTTKTLPNEIEMRDMSLPEAQALLKAVDGDVVQRALETA